MRFLAMFAKRNFLPIVLNVTCANSGAMPNALVCQFKHRTDEQHGLGSKPTYAILLCPWERHFTALSPAWWS